VKVLSLGGGVQSTTLLLLALTKQIEPLDAVIFSDTGWEPQAVYRHLDWCRGECSRAGLPFYTVSAGNIRNYVLEMIATDREIPGLPLHAVDPHGGRSMLKRQCTKHFKLVPIKRELRRITGTTGKPWKGPPIEQWLGISRDEPQRMRDSRDAWITLRYPLVERGMRRSDCLTWLDSHGFPTPPKSACLGCPFHSNAYWRELRDTSPEEWQDVVAFDRRVRTLPRIEGEAYLHRSLLPLDEVDLSTKADHGQLSLFDAECDGVCGL
jgi:hypothetical protein